MSACTYVKVRRSFTQLCSSVLIQSHARKQSSMSTFSPLNAKMRGDTDETSESRSSSIRPVKTQYRLVEHVEDLERYRPGGYHPLKIGDDLDDGRYLLVDKLGYGGYSTIWLARDLKMARYVAIKVITADASLNASEASILYPLEKSQSQPGQETVSPLIEQFWVIGPNEKHRCLVTLPARMSLFNAKEASSFGLFRPKVAQSIIAQLIRGVAFLHGEDIVHGDLHLGNILVPFPEAIDHFTTSDLYEKFGEPEPEGVIRIDGKPLSEGVPANVHIPGWFGASSDDIILGEEKIVISDFGESFNPHMTRRVSSKTLPMLQPPEARFSDKPLSFASDIWTLACTIWEIFGQRPLFEAFYPTADRVTAEQVEVIGQLPPEWWKNWNRRLEWFNEEGELNLEPDSLRGPDGMRRTWEDRFGDCIQQPRAEAGLETVTEQEKGAFETMIRSMLVFRPNERVTAQQVLHSEWMKGWGQPALEESRALSNV